MIWNKQLEYNIKTDFNVDKQAHIMLFLMAKNDVLTEYIISLVKEDMEKTQSELLNCSLCNKIMLQEMGYAIDDENNNYQITLMERVMGFQKDKDKREKDFDVENKNDTAKQYLLNQQTSKTILNTLSELKVSDKINDLKSLEDLLESMKLANLNPEIAKNNQINVEEQKKENGENEKDFPLVPNEDFLYNKKKKEREDNLAIYANINLDSSNKKALDSLASL